MTKYVRDQGAHLSVLIQKGIETPNWSNREKIAVRSVVEVVSQEFLLIFTDVTQIFTLLVKEHSSLKTPSNNYSKVKDRFLMKTAYDRKQSLVNSIIDSNANSILTFISKIALKSFIESVRLCTFNRNGFQQIQVDVYYLRAVWGALNFDDERFVSFFFFQ